MLYSAPYAAYLMKHCLFPQFIFTILRNRLGDEYAYNTGYNEVGELNNIIMLYPQATLSLGSNPNGCWDWWGYNIPNVYG